MILESYLLYQEYKKQKLAEEKRKNKDIFLIANTQPGTVDDSSSSGVGVLIFLVVVVIVSIILAIACAYFIYSCIKSQCMGFLVFVLFVILLNVPFVNIAIFFILLGWWLMRCRKPGQCRTN
jgi:ABC-type multidrug transport system permease subunit